MTNWTDIDQAVEDFFETLLWSSTDESTPDGGRPMDDNYGIEDAHENSVIGVRRDLEDFLAQARDMLEAEPKRNDWAHDFCLTANGHGAGFWDGDYERGDELTALCQPYHYDAYVGDDGIVYISGMEQHPDAWKTKETICDT
ncbi:MAG: hypothetical protein KKC03_13705 [Bacteroidetes bacterium]|nr:hypothetical protein [Bacteroidota bacterium]